RIRIENENGWKVTIPGGGNGFIDVPVGSLAKVTGVVFGQTSIKRDEPFASADAGGQFVYTTVNGESFNGDESFSGGTVATTPFSVVGTDDDPLYYTYRHGSKFSYFFKVPNGTYTLKLYFVDPTSTDTGQRKFTVSANGTTLMKNFDLVA